MANHLAMLGTTKNNQSGVALIAVLLFLILITIVGVIAVRQSRIDLKVATSDQVETLLINSSDSVLTDIEQAASPSKINSESYQAIMNHLYGVLGYYIVQPGDKVGHQTAFCYRPSDISSFRVPWSQTLMYGGGYSGRQNPKAICNSTSPKDYISARSTSMTQMVVRGLETESTAPFDSIALGEQQGNKGPEDPTPYVSIHAVSIVPALSNVTDDKITECLSLPAGDNPQLYKQAENMTACLQRYGIPNTALVEDASLQLYVQGGQKDGRLESACREGDDKCLSFMQSIQ